MQASFSELGVKRELLGKVMTLKMGYFGYIMRDSGSPPTNQREKGMKEGKGNLGGRRNSGTTI